MVIIVQRSPEFGGHLEAHGNHMYLYSLDCVRAKRFHVDSKISLFFLLKNNVDINLLCCVFTNVFSARNVEVKRDFVLWFRLF